MSQRGFYGRSIIFPPTQPAPLEILGIQTGDCGFFRVSEPLPNGNWVVQFNYLFDPIAAGESRTCTSDIEFSTVAMAEIPTNWQVDSPRDDDVNADDNRFDYTFVAAPPAPPAPVPAGSSFALACLGLALLLAGRAALRQGPSAT